MRQEFGIEKTIRTYKIYPHQVCYEDRFQNLYIAMALEGKILST